MNNEVILKRVYRQKENCVIAKGEAFKITATGFGTSARIKCYGNSGNIEAECMYKSDGSTDDLTKSIITCYFEDKTGIKPEISIVLPVYTEEDIKAMLGYDLKIK